VSEDWGECERGVSERGVREVESMRGYRDRETEVKKRELGRQGRQAEKARKKQAAGY
jgi:hypothetical protein